MIFGEEARREMLKGMEVVAAALKPTLGPKGRCAVIEKKFGSPTVINDGVTIAKEIELEQPYENLGPAFKGSRIKDQRHSRRRNHHGDVACA